MRRFTVTFTATALILLPALLLASHYTGPGDWPRGEPGDPVGADGIAGGEGASFSESHPPSSTRYELVEVHPAHATLGDRTVGTGENLILSDGSYTVTGTLTVTAGAVLTVENATVRFDPAPGATGGIFVDRDGRCRIDRSELGPTPGGQYAVSVYGGTLDCTRSIMNGTTSFEFHESQGSCLDETLLSGLKGPAIYVRDGGLTLVNCSFEFDPSSPPSTPELRLDSDALVTTLGHGGSGHAVAQILRNGSMVHRGGFVRVKVLDGGGEALEGVAVTVRDAGGRNAAEGTTGKSGRTPFMPFINATAAHDGNTAWSQRGPFAVGIVHPELGTNTTSFAEPAGQTIRVRLDGACRPPSLTATLTGTITDRHDRPLRRMPVWVECVTEGVCPADAGDETGALARTLTGADGRYALDVPLPADFEEDITALLRAGEGWRFDTVRRDVSLAPGETSVQDITLTRNPTPFDATVEKDGGRVMLDGARNVSVTTSVHLAFHAPLDPETVPGAITLRSPSAEYAVAGNPEGIIPVSVEYREANMTVVVTPDETLKGDIAFSTQHITYYLEVEDTIMNATGGPALWESWTGEFETAFPDRDGDGVSDRYDDFPDDATQQVDSDGDGYGDNPEGNDPDAFPFDETQWSDRDSDGYGDNPEGNDPDDFPDDPAAHRDTDGDGMPDELLGTSTTGLVEDNDDDGDGLSDVEEARLGTNPLKPDTDGDGVDDLHDPEPLNPAVHDDAGRVEEDGEDEGQGLEGDRAWFALVLMFVFAVGVSYALLKALGGRD